MRTRLVSVLGAVALTIACSGCTWMMRVSVAPDGTEPDAGSSDPALSADAKYVAFQSDASNLVSDDENGVTDVFVRDNTNGAIERVSVDSTGDEASGASTNPVISGDGRDVVFESTAPDLDPADAATDVDIFLHDRQTGTTSHIVKGRNPDISGDGRYIAYQVDGAVNVTPGNFPVPVSYRYDRETDTTVTLGLCGDLTPCAGGAEPSISDDGTRVAFVMHHVVGTPQYVERGVVWQDLTTNEQRSLTNVYDWFESFEPVMSGNGQAVAFTYRKRSLGGPEQPLEVGWTHLSNNSFYAVSEDAGTPDGPSQHPSISRSGRYVAFESTATNLAANNADDDPAVSDVFVKDLFDYRDLASVDSVDTPGNGDSRQAAISDDGAYVAYASRATNLVAGTPQGGPEGIFLRAYPNVGYVFPCCGAYPDFIVHLPRGQTSTFVINTHARQPLRVTVGGRGVTVNSVVGQGFIQVKVTVTVAADAPTGLRGMNVTTQGTGPGLTAASVSGCSNCLQVVN